MQSAVVKFNNLTRADGSAIYAFGNSAFQVAVYGPADVPFHKESPEKATLDVYYKRAAQSKESPPDVLALENVIKKSLETVICGELHPRSIIAVIIQELEVEGSVLSSAINAACCALLDASISMKSLIASVTTYITDKNVITSSVSSDELDDVRAELTFAFDSTNFNVLTVNSRGKFSSKEFAKCLKLAKEEAKNVFTFYRTSRQMKLSHK